MVSHLIRQLSFGWAMRISGFLMLGLLIIANLTVRPFYPPRPQKLTVAEMRKPLGELDFVLVTLGALCFSYGFFPPVNYLQVGALQAGVDPNLVQYLLSILNAASLFGRLSTGAASDKLGAYNVFVVVCSLSGVWILALWLTSSSAGAVVAFAILFGFSSAAYVSLLPQLIMAISPKNFADIGWRTGILFLAMAVGGFTTNPINGAIVDGPGGWKGLKIFSGIFCIVGALFVCVVRMRRAGWKVWVKI
jgi:predicted MFS family arabinose efflux permease